MPVAPRNEQVNTRRGAAAARGSIAALIAVAGLLAACGGSADGSRPEPAPSAEAPEVVVQSAEPAPPASDDRDTPDDSSIETATDSGSAAPASGDGGAIDAASITLPAPIQTPATPAPVPSSELNLPHPALPASEVVIPPGDCRFVYLGEWVRCENAGWPNVIETDAPDLLTCMQECLERDDCTAVTDYLWLGRQDPAFGCVLYLSTCDAPAFVPWGEEDAGHDYRRVCDGGNGSNSGNGGDDSSAGADPVTSTPLTPAP